MYSEEELIKGIKENDRKIILYIIEEIGPGIFRRLPRDISIDVLKESLHDCFFVLYRYIKTGAYKAGNIRGFLQKCISLRLKKYFSKRTDNKFRYSSLESFQDKKIEEIDSNLLDFGNVVSEEKQNCFDKYFGPKQIGEDCYALIKAFHFDRISQKEISEKTGRTYKAIRTKMYACRIKLKKKIQSDPECRKLVKV